MKNPQGDGKQHYSHFSLLDSHLRIPTSTAIHRRTGQHNRREGRPLITNLEGNHTLTPTTRPIVTSSATATVSSPFSTTPGDVNGWRGPPSASEFLHKCWPGREKTEDGVYPVSDAQERKGKIAIILPNKLLISRDCLQTESASCTEARKLKKGRERYK